MNTSPATTTDIPAQAFGVVGWHIASRKPLLMTKPGEAPHTEWVVQDILTGMQIVVEAPTALSQHALSAELKGAFWIEYRRLLIQVRHEAAAQVLASAQHVGNG